VAGGVRGAPCVGGWIATSHNLYYVKFHLSLFTALYSRSFTLTPLSSLLLSPGRFQRFSEESPEALKAPGHRN
jgi:hypothetical protein